MHHDVLVLLTCCCVLPAGCVEDQPSRAGHALTGTDGGLSCGSVSYFGCCSGETLVYCGENQLQRVACGPTGQCGWNAAFGLYSCGTGAHADPAGARPRSCPPGIISPPAPDARIDATAECPSLKYIGCCAGSTLYFCSGGHILSLDCSAQPSCGWNAQRSFYDCATSGQAEPTGRYPLRCREELLDGGARPADGSGPADQGRDVAPADSRGGLGDAVPRDGASPIRDSLSLGEQRPRDGRGQGEGIAGLEIPGLEVPSGDGNMLVVSGGGCVSCAFAQTHGAPRGLVLLLIALFGLAIKRRH